MADTELGELYGAITRGRGGISSWMGLAGAATSLALVLGLGVWGYRLMMRDVMGVPVIKALQEPMRVQPDDPGGERVAFQGLTVNEVAARGEAGEIGPELVLAPEPPVLLDHDLPRAQLAETALPDYSAQTDEAVAEALEGQGDEPLEISNTETVSAPIEVIAKSVPGVRISLVPPQRPAGLKRVKAAGPAAPGQGAGTELAAASAAAPEEVEIDADSLPVGSRLVQLGAFESADEARKAWDAIAARFDEVMAGKNRVIQQASTNGKAFFRLRVAGFADLADARRFCATLAADKTKPLCVPVATR